MARDLSAATTRIQDTTTGATLRAMREGAGMSLRALAKGAECSHQHLGYIEAGTRILARDLEQRIALAIVNHVNRVAMA